MNTHSKGFTLIELLVVIAIIGILSTVVLASLNTARDKGRDAAIKSSMQTIRVQSELAYEDNGGSYPTVAGSSCSDGLFAEPTIADAVAEITSQAPSAPTCNDAAQAWAMAAPLRDPVTANASWCTDSTGVAREITSALGTATACP